MDKMREEYPNHTGPSIVPIIIFIAVGVLLIVFLVNSTQKRPSDLSLAMECESNLEKINKALKLYAANNNEYFPPYDNEKGLGLLLTCGYLKNKDYLRCPLAKHKEKGQIDYFYHGGLIDDGTPVALCWDKVSNHRNLIDKKIDNSVNVLFFDGYVKDFHGSDWEKKVNAYLKKNFSYPKPVYFPERSLGK